jgi:hypothetical protein
MSAYGYIYIFFKTTLAIIHRTTKIEWNKLPFRSGCLKIQKIRYSYPF